MRRSAPVFLFLLLAFPPVVPGQQSSTNAPAALNETQILGRRVYQQRCAVCHTEPTLGAKRYGPALSKELVDGYEDAIREFIRNGSPNRMPGFKYGLEPSEINAIIEYLKTVPKPVARKGAGTEQGPVD
jgi:mono/diheme cytochrome c family protein